MTKKKTVKISDVNKEIAEEMKHEVFKADIIGSVNDLDESVNSLLNITSMLDKRIDMLKEDLASTKNMVKKLSGRMGI